MFLIFMINARTGLYHLRMAWEWALQLAPSIATVAAASFGLIRSDGKLRRNLRHDVETLKELPEGSSARTAMEEHVEWEIAQLRGSAKDGRRDASGAVIGAIMLLGFGYLAVWLVQHDAWWSWFWIPSAILASIGIYGVAEGLTTKKRNAQGRAIE